MRKDHAAHPPTANTARTAKAATSMGFPCRLVRISAACVTALWCWSANAAWLRFLGAARAPVQAGYSRRPLLTYLDIPKLECSQGHSAQNRSKCHNHHGSPYERTASQQARVFPVEDPPPAPDGHRGTNHSTIGSPRSARSSPYSQPSSSATAWRAATSRDGPRSTCGVAVLTSTCDSRARPRATPGSSERVAAVLSPQRGPAAPQQREQSGSRAGQHEAPVRIFPDGRLLAVLSR